jgi:hypothetical protein
MLEVGIKLIHLDKITNKEMVFSLFLENIIIEDNLKMEREMVLVQ